jgi:hypothetical protein
LHYELAGKIGSTHLERNYFAIAAVLVAWFNRKAMFRKAVAVTDVIFPSHRFTKSQSDL